MRIYFTSSRLLHGGNKKTKVYCLNKTSQNPLVVWLFFILVPNCRDVYTHTIAAQHVSTHSGCNKESAFFCLARPESDCIVFPLHCECRRETRNCCCHCRCCCGIIVVLLQGFFWVRSVAAVSIVVFAADVRCCLMGENCTSSSQLARAHTHMAIRVTSRGQANLEGGKK